MSSYSSRQRYDREATDEFYERSTGGYSYRLDPVYATSCKECYPPFGPRGFRGASTAPGFVIDADSVIRGYTKIHSKSNRQQIPDSVDVFELRNLPDCHPFLETEYSRYTNPIQNYRGLGFDNFYPVNHDPQCHIFWDFSRNTKLEAKDAYITPWQIPMEQRDLLPGSKLGPARKPCSPDSNCMFAPYNPENNLERVQ
jgi:hypothetical protein